MGHNINEIDRIDRLTLSKCKVKKNLEYGLCVNNLSNHGTGKMVFIENCRIVENNRGGIKLNQNVSQEQPSHEQSGVNFETKLELEKLLSKVVISNSEILSNKGEGIKMSFMRLELNQCFVQENQNEAILLAEEAC